MLGACVVVMAGDVSLVSASVPLVIVVVCEDVLAFELMVDAGLSVVCVAVVSGWRVIVLCVGVERVVSCGRESVVGLLWVTVVSSSALDVVLATGGVVNEVAAGVVVSVRVLVS